MVTRYRKAGDPFGWEKEVISRYFDEATAEAVMPSTARWADLHADHTIDQVVDDATVYLDFSWGVALNHRNNEVQRCMFKLDYWCWLLGAEPLRFAEDTPQGLYRVGVFREVARFLGQRTFPPLAYREYTDRARIPLTAEQRQRLARMADGQPCVIGCPDGCLWRPDDPVEAAL
jgi:hypothetical protein